MTPGSRPRDWVRATSTPGLTVAALVVTPATHLGANALPWLLGHVARRPRRSCSRVT